MNKSTAWKHSLGIRFLCIIGILLSAYSLYVKHRIEKDSSYGAMCDISDRIRCTNVFHSKYGNGFGIIGHWTLGGDESILNQPNGIIGIIFYVLVVLLVCSASGCSRQKSNPRICPSKCQYFTFNLHLTKVQIVLSLLSNLISIYLAYLLYFVFDNLCVVCATLYVVNILLLILSVEKHSHLVRNAVSTKTK